MHNTAMMGSQTTDGVMDGRVVTSSPRHRLATENSRSLASIVGAREALRQRESVLEVIRGDVGCREPVDRELIDGLRFRLENAVERAIGSCGEGGGSETECEERAPALYVTRRLINYELSAAPTGTYGVAGADGDLYVGTSVAFSRNVLVGALFRQVVMVGSIEDPLRDALGALEVEGWRDDVLEFVKGLRREEKVQLAREVTAHARGIAGRWPRIPSGWLPRTCDRVTISVAGGRVVFGALVDLIVGPPSRGRSSTCVVTVKTGEARVEDRDDAHFCALLETLRSDAPPFRVVTYYTRNGQLDVDDVTPSSLERTLARVVRASTLAIRRRREEGGL